MIDTSLCSISDKLGTPRLWGSPGVATGAAGNRLRLLGATRLERLSILLQLWCSYHIRQASSGCNHLSRCFDIDGSRKRIRYCWVRMNAGWWPCASKMMWEMQKLFSFRIYALLLLRLSVVFAEIFLQNRSRILLITIVSRWPPVKCVSDGHHQATVLSWVQSYFYKLQSQFGFC